ncbi:MAG TPA: hypothetical protein VFU43_03040 [Streptosporangiaceae bacterium]|nr:hypothetical protein [Streptosporangiaceae bacterium]
MTTPAPPVRDRPRPRGGWWLVAAGWLIQVPAAAGAMFVSDLFFVLSLLGVACIGAGSYLLRGKATAWVIFGALFGGLILVTGLITGAETLAKNLWGKTAHCQVQEVQRKVTTETTRDADGRPTGQRTIVFYSHELACPDRSYTVNGARPRPEGSSAEVRYDPRGSDPPEFTDEAGAGEFAFSAAALALGGLIELLLPLIAWRRGRRATVGPAGGPPPPHGAAAGPWPGAGPGPGPYGAPRPAEPVPLESPRFEQAVRDSMGPSLSPGRQVALPFVVRLLRRRMGVKEAPPPNPLAGRYPPPQPPPPQGPPVDRPPPPNAPPYGPPDGRR